MSAPIFFYRSRLSFPGLTCSFMETGREMARFAELAVEVLAPEVSWQKAVSEHADLELLERWEATHIVRFEGRGDDGELRGRGESRLMAGGRGKHLGGSARIVIETVRPTRRLVVETPCDVTHWDVRGGPLDEAQIIGLIRCLEITLERGAQRSGEQKEAIDRVERALVENASAEDARVWLDDLSDAQLEARLEPTDAGHTLVLVRADLADPDALHAARVTVGEIFAEAGHADWEERAVRALLGAPYSSP